ncbi:MAG: 50S ribosomal protein L25 [Rhodothermaceae bacterium]|nr:50S ribosomal protein L25 [Rhodothermaceae bacterium]
MDTLTLNVQPRETGKKAVKATRNAGLVPGVLYGAHQEPVHFSTEVLDLRPLIHTSATHRIELVVDGASEPYDCIVKTVDFHPVTDAPIHIDFQALTEGEKLTMTVPIHLDGIAVGVKDGGVLGQPLNELELRCLPKDIPGSISVDISAMEIGDSIHVEDLSLPGEIEVLTDPARTLVTVSAPRLEVEEEPTETLGLFGDEVIEGVEGEAPEGAEDAGDDESAE